MGEIEKLAESFLSRNPESENEQNKKAREYIKHIFFASMLHFFSEMGEDFVFAENDAEKIIRQVKMVDEIQKYMKAEIQKNNFKTY